MPLTWQTRCDMGCAYYDITADDCADRVTEMLVDTGTDTDRGGHRLEDDDENQVNLLD